MRCLRLLVCLGLLGVTRYSVSQSDTLDSLIDAGHFKQVARALSSAASNDPRTLFLLSRVKQAFGQHDQALRLAEAAVNGDATKATYHLQLASVLSDEVNTAGLLKRMSLGSRIRSELETALKLDPKNLDGLEGMMRFYDEAPGIAGGSKQKARQMAEEIVRIDPSRGYLAQAHLARSNREEGQLEDLYLRAFKANPRNVEALYELASFYASEKEKKYDLAEKYAREAIEVDASRSGPYSISAITAAAEKKWSDLDSVLAQAEHANRDDLNPFYQAGRTLLQLNEHLTRAEVYIRKYLSQDPEGNTPPLSAAHWRLALILEKEGRKDDAIKELQESVRLQPDFENAKKDLKRLQR